MSVEGEWETGGIHWRLDGGPVLMSGARYLTDERFGDDALR